MDQSFKEQGTLLPGVEGEGVEGEAVMRSAPFIGSKIHSVVYNH